MKKLSVKEVEGWIMELPIFHQKTKDFKLAKSDILSKLKEGK